TLLALAAGLAFGLCYWLRYAGLFYIAALPVLAALTWVAGRRDASRAAVVAFVVALLLAACGMVRNIILVGSWRGGNTMEAKQPLVGLAHNFVVGIKDIVFGPMSLSEMLALHGVYAVILFVGFAVWAKAMLGARIGKRANAQMAVRRIDLTLVVLVA